MWHLEQKLNRLLQFFPPHVKNSLGMRLAPGMQVHFRLAFDQHSDVHSLEMLTTQEPSSRCASFYKTIKTKWERLEYFCECLVQQKATFCNLTLPPCPIYQTLLFQFFEGLDPRLLWVPFVKTSSSIEWP